MPGKYRPGHEFDEDDQRHDWEDYHGEKFARTYAVAERLDGWARDHGRDLSQLALAWPTAHPAVASSIVGIRTPDQARLNARAGDWTLTPSDLQEIDEIQGGLRLHFYHGPDREYYGFRDEGDPEYTGLGRGSVTLAPTATPSTRYLAVPGTFTSTPGPIRRAGSGWTPWTPRAEPRRPEWPASC